MSDAQRIVDLNCDELTKKVVASLETGNLMPYRDMVAQLNETVSLAELAAGVLKLYCEGGDKAGKELVKITEPPKQSTRTSRNRKKKQRSTSNNEAKQSKLDGDSTRLFFSVGKRARINATKLSELICKEASINPASIGKVQVLDRYSFVEIAADQSQNIIEAMNKKTVVSGRPITVEQAKDQ
jgi:hypothetical protein